LVSYVLIEGEAIKDANDKMMIVSYAHGKIETIDWYIDLIDSQTSNYTIPHSRTHLVDVKQQLQAAIKKIMDTPIPSSSTLPQYPKGYEG
jgi:hypothetical protein